MRLWSAIPTQRLAVPLRIASTLRISVSRPSQNVAQSTPPQARRNQPMYTGTVHKFLNSIQRLVLDRQPAYASEIFHKVMNDRFQSRERSRVFLLATNLFLKYGHAREAMQVYSYMTLEGLIPPTRLRTTMYVIRRIATEPIPNVDSAMSAVEAIVKDKSFDESCLCFLLGKLAQVYHIPTSFIKHVVQAFLQSQPHGFTLSKKTELYLAYIHERVRPGSSPGLSFRTSPTPSNQVSKLPTSSLSRKTTYQANAIPPSIRATRYFRRRFFNRGMRLYRFIGEHPAGPTVILFTFLLRKITKFTKAGLRAKHILPRPTNLPSLRELHRDILRSHIKSTKNRPQRQSALLNATLLNKTISALSSCEDYAGAFVALGVFRLCRLPITLDTYKSILSPLFDRIQVELLEVHRDIVDYSEEHTYPKESWALRFLAHPDHANLRVDLNMIETILHVGEESGMGLVPLAWTQEERDARIARTVASEQRGHVIPDASLLIGLTPPTYRQYNPAPLYRILRRAILAVPRKIFVSPPTFVSKVVTEAKSEMLP